MAFVYPSVGSDLVDLVATPNEVNWSGVSSSIGCLAYFICGGVRVACDLDQVIAAHGGFRIISGPTIVRV